MIVGIFILLRILYLGNDLYAAPQIDHIESPPEYDNLQITEHTQETTIEPPKIIPRDASLDF